MDSNDTWTLLVCLALIAVIILICVTIYCCAMDAALGLEIKRAKLVWIQKHGVDISISNI